MGIKAYLYYIVILFSILVSDFQVFCQQATSVPPTYWENYMSFKIGNYFEYEYNEGLYRYSRRIVGDTIVQSIGKHYYKIEYISPIPSPPSYQFERIDSVGDWYTFYSGTQQQCRIYRLDIPLGFSFLNCYGVYNIILQDTFSLGAILGSSGPYFVRKYYHQSLAPGDDYIAKKFQIYYRYSYEGGNYANLVGAIIDSIVYGSISGISREKTAIPKNLRLCQNYPNPFNPRTVITFQIPKTSLVNLTVYDNAGKEITALVNEYMNAGNYSINFEGANLSSGVYFYRLMANEYRETKKMILLK